MTNTIPELSNGIWHAYLHWSTLQSLKVIVVVSENSQIVQCVFGGKARKNQDMASSTLITTENNSLGHVGILLVNFYLQRRKIMQFA